MMKPMKELLERTSLRALGVLLTDREGPQALMDEAQTAEEMLALVYDNLNLALRNGGSQRDERVRRAADKIRDAGWQLGFLAGMKTGARLVLSLTDESEIAV